MNLRSKRNKKVLKVRREKKSLNLNKLGLILLRILEKVDDLLEYLMK
ncbi:hypothetical protein [uncultured Methanobacterium sp.]|nr:hypothetical protein [uncultured Methanobacterium sp.]